MSSSNEHHIFSKRRSTKTTLEATISGAFRIATYIVILCAGYIFLNIAINGSKAVFTSEAPFINIEFLTQKPQTLHVFEPKEIDAELKAAKAQIVSLKAKQRNLGSGETDAAHTLELEIEALNERIDALDVQRKAGRLMYGDDAYRALDEEPSSELYVYSNYAYSGGGIGPAIIGTCLLVVGSIAIALTLGILCAIYLSEYSRPGKTLQLIRLSILNLSGVPSIVFGLFGFGMFVLFFDWGVSMIAGWFTLAIMALPVIIAASEESMKAIPKGFREGSLALGASKWTTIRTNVLPYHIYVVSAKIPQNEYTRNMQYGAAFVFLLIVGFFALSSIVLRIKIRKKYKW
jgi:phosphate transport system permease protein